MSHHHCVFCFNTLQAHLNDKDLPEWTDKEDEKGGLFVSWKNRQTGKLRGCLGTFKDERISKSLSEYAIASATKDGRFSPIEPWELEHLTVTVSLLHQFEEAESLYDWKIGIHGVRINFGINGKTYSANYLPNVMVEQGWSKEQTIISLIRKAGYNDKSIDQVIQLASLSRYCAKVCTLSFDEFSSISST